MYKQLYFKLFNALTDAIRALEQKDTARAWEILMMAQRETEELYISDDK